jgi:hypothetical protein
MVFSLQPAAPVRALPLLVGLGWQWQSWLLGGLAPLT